MRSDHSLSEALRVGEFRRRTARHVQCRSCGFDAPAQPAPRQCPKCGGGCWESFVRVGKLSAEETNLATSVAVPPPEAARVGVEH